MSRPAFRIEHNGCEMTLREIARASGVPYITIWRRFHAGKRDAALVAQPATSKASTTSHPNAPGAHQP